MPTRLTFLQVSRRMALLFRVTTWQKSYTSLTLIIWTTTDILGILIQPGTIPSLFLLHISDIETTRVDFLVLSDAIRNLEEVLCSFLMGSR